MISRPLIFIMPLVLVLITAGTTAHEYTRSAYLKTLRLAQVQAQLEAERAPTPDQAESACRLTIELRIDSQPNPMAGLIRITDLATGKPLSFSTLISRANHWYVISGRTPLLLPKTKIQIEAFHGLTTQVSTQVEDLTNKSDSSLVIALKTFYDPAKRNLVAGNTHLHLMKLTRAEATHYLETVPRADGLDLVFLSYLIRPSEDQNYISNTFSKTDLGALSRDGLLFGNGEEHRHNFDIKGEGHGHAYGEGYGHVMFLDLLRKIEPASLGSGIMGAGSDGTPLQKGVREARGDGATIIWCHNKFGHEDIPNWVEGLVDAQNIFDGSAIGSYYDTFYRYLNLGMRVPFSTGTDWFITDFSRVYVPINGEITVKRWLAALAEGKSSITNGVFLEFDVERVSQPKSGSTKSNETGRTFQPGSTIYARSGEELVITARAVGRNDFKRLELVQNARVINSVTDTGKQGYFEATMKVHLKTTEPGWIAVRIPTDIPSPENSAGTSRVANKVGGVDEFGMPLFAHTSPIYIEVDGHRIFQTKVANGLIAEMEDSMKTIVKQGAFANNDERESVLTVYRTGISRVRNMIDASRK